LFITKTPTHNRKTRDLWFRSLDLRPLDQPAVNCNRTAHLVCSSIAVVSTSFKLHLNRNSRLKCSHHLGRETFTAGHRPPPKFSGRSQDDRSCATLIQRLPATFTRSSVHLVGGLPTLRLPLRSRHSRTFPLQRPSVFAMCPAHCHLRSAIHRAINIPTAGAQAFLMDYSQGERAITHHAGPVRISGC
jgi:hypothetical protein